jgi:hypothetical protein
MSKTIALSLVLAAFSALTLYAIGSYGYVGFFEVLLSNVVGIQVLADIVVACTLALVWMSGDARERGLPFWLYAALTLFLGSIGLLAYLIHRELRALRTPQRVAA